MAIYRAMFDTCRCGNRFIPRGSKWFQKLCERCMLEEQLKLHEKALIKERYELSIWDNDEYQRDIAELEEEWKNGRVQKATSETSSR